MGFSLSSSFLKKGLGAVGAAVGGLVGGLPGAALGSKLADVGPSEDRLDEREYQKELRDLYAFYERQLADNKAMYELQKNDSVKFWNMQNEYNSPAMQMERLAAANLNPMLVYSSGVDNTAGPISTPSLQVPHVSGLPRSKSRKSKSDSKFFDDVSKFFLNKSMESAENQNETQDLINENWRLRNLKLARDIENSGNLSLSNKVRSSYKPTLAEIKEMERRIGKASLPGSKLTLYNPYSWVEHGSYKLADILGSLYYKNYNKADNTKAELY